MAFVPQKRVCDRTPSKVIEAGEKVYTLPGFTLKDADGKIVLQHDGYKELCEEGYLTCLGLLKQIYRSAEPKKRKKKKKAADEAPAEGGGK